jgi:hypothetical protein
MEAGPIKGTKHVSTWIQELLNDEKFTATVRNGLRTKRYKGAPLKAMIRAQAILAINGDTRAFDVLLKHGWGKVEPDPMDTPQNPIVFINNVPIGLSPPLSRDDNSADEPSPVPRRLVPPIMPPFPK